MKVATAGFVDEATGTADEVLTVVAGTGAGGAGADDGFTELTGAGGGGGGAGDEAGLLGAGGGGGGGATVVVTGAGLGTVEVVHDCQV